MRVALNSWPPGIPTGLGTMAKDFLNLLPFCKAVSSKHPRFHDPGSLDGRGLTAVVDALADVDAVVALERPTPDPVFREAKAMGKRTVLVVMHEWINPRCPWLCDTDLFIAPNQLCLSKLYGMGLVDRTRRMDPPLDLDRLPFTLRTKAERFMFSNGWGGVNGRKGWPEMEKAVALGIDVAVYSQTPVLGSIGLHHGQTLTTEAYPQYDVIVVPSRCEGFGYAILEPMAMGLPVLTTDAEPMRSVLRAAYRELAAACLLPINGVQMHDVWQFPVEYAICSPQGIADRVAAARGWPTDLVRELSLRGRHYAETRHGAKAKEELWQTLTKW